MKALLGPGPNALPAKRRPEEVECLLACPPHRYAANSAWRQLCVLAHNLLRSCNHLRIRAQLPGNGYGADDIVRAHPELEREDVLRAAQYGAWLASERSAVERGCSPT